MLEKMKKPSEVLQSSRKTVLQVFDRASINWPFWPLTADGICIDLQYYLIDSKGSVFSWCSTFSYVQNGQQEDTRAIAYLCPVLNQIKWKRKSIEQALHPDVGAVPCTEIVSSIDLEVRDAIEASHLDWGDTAHIFCEIYALLQRNWNELRGFKDHDVFTSAVANWDNLTVPQILVVHWPTLHMHELPGLAH